MCEGLANYGVRGNRTHQKLPLLLIQIAELCASQNHPGLINHLEGLTELPESYYTHQYNSLQGKDKN